MLSITPIYLKTPKGYWLERKSNMSQSIFFKTKDAITCLADTKRTVIKGEEDKSLLHKVRYINNTIFLLIGYANLNDYIMYVLANSNYPLLMNLKRLESELQEIIPNEKKKYNYTGPIGIQAYLFQYDKGKIIPYYLQVVDTEIDVCYGENFAKRFTDFYGPGLYCLELPKYLKNFTFPKNSDEAIKEGTKLLNIAIELDKKNNNKFVDAPIEWVSMDNNGKIKCSNPECKFKRDE